MVIGGLWHGASWTFVIWGAIHGLGLAVHRFWQVARGNKKSTGAWKIFNIFVTVQFVCFAWIFFRAVNWENAYAILSRIGSLSFSAVNISASLGFIMTLGILAHYCPKKWYDFSLSVYSRAPFYVQALALALLVIGLQYVAQTGATPFIYNKF
jgi:D-alanyl-lipoteichoic acid acyltransferase DltB (MBOAT superfamily)